MNVPSDDCAVANRTPQRKLQHARSKEMRATESLPALTDNKVG